MIIARNYQSYLGVLLRIVLSSYLIKTKQDNTAPFTSNQIQSIQDNSRQHNSIYIKSNQIKSNQIKSNQIKSNQTKSNQIVSNQIKSNQIKSNSSKSNQIQVVQYAPMSESIDDQWMDYLSDNGVSILYVDKHEPERSNSPAQEDIGQMYQCDKEAEADAEENEEEAETEAKEKKHKGSGLIISTKTKVMFLHSALDVTTIFWNISIIPYWNPVQGIIKKQMKIISKSMEEYTEYCEKLKGVPFYHENIISRINNPLSRTLQFRDERKLTIGISKKDIMSDLKKKNAFYNCFALTLRIFHDNLFKEIHVKVFNTGKMEIPGVVNDDLFLIVKNTIIDILEKASNQKFNIDNITISNILINSNFSCGFYINRQLLYAILVQSYNIETSYDPCTYPGIKCKFYYINNPSYNGKQNGYVLEEDMHLKKKQLNNECKYTEVSIMIFRTGSCLIVGNCDENIIYFVFDFIKNILLKEKDGILIQNSIQLIKKKYSKIKKKNVFLTNDYFSTIPK
jgi:hypothetical protein